MADPTLIITFGADEFPLSHVSAQEVIKAKMWTGCRNRRAWFNAIGDEEPEALLAALVIAKQRKGEPVDYATVDFDLDGIDAKFIDDGGREVEPVFMTDSEGAVMKDSSGAPIAVTDKNGKPQWRDVATGTVIPFGISESKTTSITPLTPGSSSVSAGGLPPTERP
jgi:hypothetical protein